ncbi:unnamed protein product [Urochloa humidicola]
MGRRKVYPAIAVAIVLLCMSSAALAVAGAKGGGELTTQLQNGFTATHTAGATAAFEPVLHAPNGVFAFGFLRVGAASLDLAVVHLPSSFPLWRATPARVGDWSSPATLTFDNSLVLTGQDGGVLWQTLDTIGDTVALLNSSNLILRRYENPVPSWQSFDNPSDTLVLGQNFTASSSPLISGNRRFALRLGKTFMALHMEFYGGRPATPAYWRHTALEAEQAQKGTEQPPVYGRLDARGFFGLYIDAGGGGGGEQKVDVLSFDTFVQNLTSVFRRMTVEDDGNLSAYYWAGDSKDWVSDYRAIADRCDLPTPCGAYGLCVPGAAQCRCLDNSTSASAASAPCGAEETADLCAAAGDGQQQQVEFEVVRRARVSVAYKELLPLETNKTAEECEAACAGNCSCWGAVYNGGSGYCYLINFPVETMVYEADDRKVGYFKVRRLPGPKRTRMSPGVAAATAVVSLVLVGLAVAGACLGYRLWERRRRKRAGMEQELVPGPYKDLKSMGSSNNSFK